MDTEEKDVGQIAIEVATKGEDASIGKLKYVCDWKKFGRFVGVWVITAIVLFSALLIINVATESENIIYETIRGVDTINMMFSLVLSALFEQIWSKKGSHWLYNITLGAEMAMAFIGCMLFLAYSIIEKNRFWTQYWVHYDIDSGRCIRFLFKSNLIYEVMQKGKREKWKL